MNNSPQRAAKGFTKAFWVSNTVELFERMAFYAVFIVLTIYLSSILGFNDFEASMISGLFSGGLYLLPIFSGAYADKNRIPQVNDHRLFAAVGRLSRTGCTAHPAAIGRACELRSHDTVQRTAPKLTEMDHRARPIHPDGRRFLYQVHHFSFRGA